MVWRETHVKAQGHEYRVHPKWLMKLELYEHQ